MKVIDVIRTHRLEDMKKHYITKNGKSMDLAFPPQALAECGVHKFECNLQRNTVVITLDMVIL